jgi:pyruvate kinase
VTINRLNLLWGTKPLRCVKVATAEALIDQAETILEGGGYVRPRDVIAIVAGTRSRSGSTNFLRLHVMGENVLTESRGRTENGKPGQVSLRRRHAKATKSEDET